jgi:hypothetical protein
VGASLKFVAGLVVFSALVLTAGTGATASVSGARSHIAVSDHQAAVPMAGITTCPLDVKLKLSSPLTGTPTAGPTTVTFEANSLKGCSNRSQGNVKIVRGYLSSLTGTLAAGTACIPFLEGLTAPGLEGGVVKWTPPSKVEGSTGISFPAGGLTSSQSQLHLQYSEGTVVGSYPTASATISANTDADIATLTNLCNIGLSVIGFSGSISL